MLYESYTLVCLPALPPTKHLRQKMKKAIDIALDAIVRCKRIPLGRTRKRMLRDVILELCIALEQDIKETRNSQVYKMVETPILMKSRRTLERSPQTSKKPDQVLRLMPNEVPSSRPTRLNKRSSSSSRIVGARRLSGYSTHSV